MNLKKFFTDSPTSRTDIVMAVGAVIVAGYKAVETIRDYMSENKEKK